MGSNNLCWITHRFLLFFCPMSFFIRMLLHHVTFYNICIYIIIIVCKVPMSIFVFYKISTLSPGRRVYNFYKILTSPSSFYQGPRRILQLLKWPCRASFLRMWSLCNASTLCKSLTGTHMATSLQQTLLKETLTGSKIATSKHTVQVPFTEQRLHIKQFYSNKHFQKQANELHAI